ncbi:MAG: ABC transporter substrate-binding protein [Actinobacteria bacterium]|nr:ABC transporter substrate-binding protein [Actinomycetota bacterium]
MHHRAATKLSGALIVCAGSLAGCTGGSTPVAGTDSAVSTSTTVRPDDGMLLVGAILPRNGSAAELGLSMSDALSLALTEINDAGGVGGSPVRLIEREEGDNPATASVAMVDLVQAGVDAIIGPTSSINTLATLGTAVDAGILTCSPTASALALDAFPDDGLFLRTIASDTLQAEALASLVESSGTSSAVVVYIDDNYGRPFAEAARLGVLAKGTSVEAMVGFTANEGSVGSAVEAVVAADTDVVVVIADSTTGPAIIAAIDDASDNAPTFIVNDAIRRPATSTQPFGRSLASRIQGVSPLAYPSSESFMNSLHALDPATTALFAHNAYDCLNVIALAAQAAASGRPSDIARQVATITDGGTVCNSFPGCEQARIAGRNIDYSGPGRDLTLGPDGDVLTAVFERFTFDATGRDIGDGFVTVGG